MLVIQQQYRKKGYDNFQERCFEENNGIDRLFYVIDRVENSIKGLSEGVGEISNKYKGN